MNEAEEKFDTAKYDTVWFSADWPVPELQSH